MVDTPCSGPATHWMPREISWKSKQLVQVTIFMRTLLIDFADGQNDLLIVSTLDLLHGVLLIHPPSRSLFAREIYMNVCGAPRVPAENLL